MIFRYSLTIILIGLLLQACESKKKVAPKPRTYPQVEFPDRTYKILDKEYCPLIFEIPAYAVFNRKEQYFDTIALSECWFDLILTPFDAILHCSYYPINNERQYQDYLTDAFELVDKHKVRANFIDRYPIEKKGIYSGFMFDIKGPVASPRQFFLTDSSTHFFRASLYFDQKVNTDSLSIVIDFIDNDLKKILESFAWKS
jgi:gliding motility-associated lipoprotein GldD